MAKRRYSESTKDARGNYWAEYIDPDTGEKKRVAVREQADENGSYYSVYDKDAPSDNNAGPAYQTSQLGEDSWRWAPGSVVSPEEFSQFFQRLDNPTYTKDTDDLTLENYFSDPRAAVRMENGQYVYRPELAQGDYRPKDLGPSGFLGGLKEFLTSPGMAIMAPAIGGIASAAMSGALGGAGAAAGGAGAAGLADAFPTFLGDAAAGGLGGAVGSGAGAMLDNFGMPLIDGGTFPIGPTEGFSEWSELLKASPDAFSNFGVDPSSFFVPAAATAGTWSEIAQLGDAAFENAGLGQMPNNLGGDGILSKIFQGLNSPLGTAAKALLPGNWDWAEGKGPSVGGLLSSIGSTALGYKSASDAADRTTDVYRQAQQMAQQDRGDRLPFLQTAQQWTQNPASFWGGDVGQEIARQTSRVIGGARGENLYDNPTGQSLVMQSLAPVWLNAVTSMANQGLRNTAPISALSTIGLQSAGAQGMPGAVLGGGFADLFGNQGANQIGDLNAQLRRLMQSQTGGSSTALF